MCALLKPVCFLCVRRGCEGLGATEEKLQIFGSQSLHCLAISIDSAGDHVCFLLLQRDNTRLYTVLDAETGDHARASLTNAVTAVCRLPFRGWIPPWVDDEYSRLDNTISDVFENIICNYVLLR